MACLSPSEVKPALRITRFIFLLPPHLCLTLEPEGKTLVRSSSFLVRPFAFAVAKAYRPVVI